MRDLLLAHVGDPSKGARKKVKYCYLIPVVIFLIASTTVAFFVPFNLPDENKKTPVYVGISFTGNTTSEAKLLIDRVKSYINLFVLQSFVVSRNETAIYEICDYAVAQGLNIIVNLGTYDNVTWPWHYDIFVNATARWGSQFLGAYYDDEPGGMQLDYNWTELFTSKRVVDSFEAVLNVTSLKDAPPFVQMYAKFKDSQINGTKSENYNLEAETFFYLFTTHMGYSAFKNITAAGIKMFTSDYALYWYGYQVGYDVLLTQLGWNNSYIKEIDLIKGAARLQNKEWGAIITWKYNETPYLDTGEEIYNQMLTAYQAGAKYVIIFNYPQIEGNPYGAMTNEHFAALEKFSNDIKATSKIRNVPDESKADAVLVLPNNYGWGMRTPSDKIWGYWAPDEKSTQIWNITNKLVQQYRLGLDIVYDDPAFPVTGKYNHIYYWNSTL
jgi:hypothetical protein